MSSSDSTGPDPLPAGPDTGCGAHPPEPTARARRRSSWIADRRERSETFDLAVSLYERDRDAFGSMPGSAIALRLFLFVVVALMLLVGGAGLVSGEDGIRRMIDTAGVTGIVAGQLDTAARSAHRSSWGMLLIGAVLTPWAGRALTLVLSAASAGAWRVRGLDVRVTFRLVTAITATFVAVLGLSLLLSEIRADGALVTTAAALVAAAGLYTIAWFGITWLLPRTNPDPGALLPGALLLGAVMAAAQWVVQFWLPQRISRSSGVVGSFGVSVAALGYFFVVGRMMAASLVADAVVFERVGSLSRAVFALPGVRRLPERWPALGQFFALDPVAPDEAPGDGSVT
jgi:uncharacterized BrkB/YihY/UPF0761 family membrane protein